MKKIYYLFALIGLVSLFSGCEKDGDEIRMLDNPIAPSIVSMPDLTLLRENGTNMVEFVGTPVDPGFTASATYFLEVCATGNNFEDALVLYSGIQDTLIKFSVSELNALLLKKFKADQISSADFRIRASLVVDAGTGALGTSTNPLEYSSITNTSDITIYGLPRLDLIGSGIAQKIESALGNGVYTGYVKLDKTLPFTLLDPDANKTYGANGAALAENGAGITSPDNGYYMLSVNVPDLKYTMDPYMIGLIGSATPNEWNTPDQKMDYNIEKGTWYITLNLKIGEIKFRKNDGWAWNLGGDPKSLKHDGTNIAITSAGNYTITLTITNDTQGSATGSCTIVKN